MLSRRPIQSNDSGLNLLLSAIDVDSDEQELVNTIFDNPTLHALNAKEFSAETTTDPILIRVTAYVQQGWPKKCPDDELRSFFTVRDELTVVSGCLYRGDRAIIPSSL